MFKKVFATAAVLAMAISAAQAQSTVVFDSATGVTSFGAASAPGRSFMGQAYNAANPGAPLKITGIDFGLVSITAQAYTDLRVQFSFWNTFNPAATTTTAFSNQVGTYTVDLGPQNLSASTVYTFGPSASDNGATVTFATPVSLSGYTNLGLTIAFQSSIGTGALAYSDNLTAAIRGGTGAPPFAVGSVASGASPSFGYFRNASGRTDFNFLGSDGRQVGDNSALYLRLYAAPEPSQYAAFGLGLLGLGGLALKARRRSVIA